MSHTAAHPAHPVKPSWLLPYIKRNAVLCIALALALGSIFLVPPDAQYLEYVDLKTLCCLFGTLAVVCALKNIRFFSILARRIILLAGNARAAGLVLICITFIGSMLIANDMALLTFLPLGYIVFSAAGQRRDVATVFILQNIAANLGGMLTPFGNPQNLYLYAHYNIPNGEFLSIMLPPFAVSMTLVALCCLLIPKRSLRLADKGDQSAGALPPVKTAIYLALFTLTILMVFRVLPPALVLAVVVAALLVCDRKALKMVDYELLMTFVCFFVFAGNMARLAPVRAFFSCLLERNTLLTAVLSCQVISNVPSAILLSPFTSNYPALLAGVNIGGTGTLIASLASLITFREYCAHYRETVKEYLIRFTVLNVGFLVILTALELLIL